MGIGQFLVLALVAHLVLDVGFGLYIAAQKGRSEGEAICFAVLLGPLGLILLALLPTVAAPAALSDRVPKTLGPPPPNFVDEPKPAAPAYRHTPRALAPEGDKRPPRKIE